jgi:1-acyl-sn-glycerol-3-phosphate acyltransferase
MIVLRLASIAAATLILGSTAIILCLLIPGGAAFIPLARFWSWLILKICGVARTASYHPRLDPSRPAIYMANHQSQLDIPALVLAMPARFRIVAKRELLYVPIFGWALWLAGFIFIDRTDRKQAFRSLDRAARKVRRGTSIVLFAEGTRSPDGRLLPFKKGGFVLALQAGAPIVPVSIRGGHQVLPKGSLRVRPGAIDVVMGEPIETSRYSLDTKDVLIETVRRRVAEGLATPKPSSGD